MVSREGRGEYGTGVKDPDRMTEEDIRNMNPHGHKLTKIPEEIMCPSCDRVMEYTFPVQDAVFCLSCANKVKERTDVKSTYKPYITASSPIFCFRCGKDVNLGWKITTHVCYSCVRRAGRYELGRRARQYARRVA